MSTSNKEEDFAALLAEYEQVAPTPRRRDLPKVGDKVSGRVVSIGREAVFVALGGKAEAQLDITQVTGPDGAVEVAIDDTIEARVALIQNGQIFLRVTMGRGPDARAEIAQAFEHGIPVEGLVTAVNKGGVDVQVAGMRGFCPVSQLDNRFVEDPNTFVGQRLSFRITRYEPGRGDSVNIVLSRRALREEEAAVKAAETRAQLSVGAVVRGTVTSLKSYGAFVDLGGIEGMLHVSELGFSRVDAPSDVLAVGQTVEVQVIKLEKTGDAKRPEKISLSLKALADDPWDQVAKELVEGARVRGKVVRLQQFGAFVEIRPGVEGLIHISELAHGRRINHPREVLSEGAEVEAVVLAVEHERRRVSLSLSAVAVQEETAVHQAYKPPESPRLGTFADLLSKKR